VANYPIAVCKWSDAHGSDGTIEANAIDHKPYVFTLVGFLIRSDAVGVSIAAELGEDGKIRDCSFVPRKLVLDEYVLGPAKKRKPRKLAEGKGATSPQQNGVAATSSAAATP
jgi:hypothetical protein